MWHLNTKSAQKLMRIYQNLTDHRYLCCYKLAEVSGSVFYENENCYSSSRNNYAIKMSQDRDTT